MAAVSYLSIPAQVAAGDADAIEEWRSLCANNPKTAFAILLGEGYVRHVDYVKHPATAMLRAVWQP